jgi:hypothetical protein
MIENAGTDFASVLRRRLDEARQQGNGDVSKREGALDIIEDLEELMRESPELCGSLRTLLVDLMVLAAMEEGRDCEDRCGDEARSED